MSFKKRGEGEGGLLAKHCPACECVVSLLLWNVCFLLCPCRELVARAHSLLSVLASELTSKDSSISGD